MARGIRVGLAGTALVLAAAACGDEPAANEPADAPPTGREAVREMRRSNPRDRSLAASGTNEVREGEVATLDVRVTPQASRDTRYAWKQLPGGPRVELQGSNTARASFRAPQDVNDYAVSFEVEASDLGGSLRAGPISVRVLCKDDPPEVEAYAPAMAECGALVVLQGQGRTYEQRQALAFEWMQVGEGPHVSLTSADRPQASFVAPDGTGPYSLEFELHVRDGVNADSVARARIAIECDPAAAALAHGEERALAGDPVRQVAPAQTAWPLPRGGWSLGGRLALAPDANGAAGVLLRFEIGEQHAVAISATAREDELALRMFGMQRESALEPWREPESSGARALGELALEPGLAFVFDWDGRELGVRFGPPGDPATWPESPYPISFPLAARPRSVAIMSESGTATLADWSITGR